MVEYLNVHVDPAWFCARRDELGYHEAEVIDLQVAAWALRKKREQQAQREKELMALRHD